MSGTHLKRRITDLASAMSAGLHEREEHAAVILLAALSGQNIFLLGPPGTAKSLLARRLASVFEGVGDCFEYLMHRFSTPEEIFGPVSIAELKNDRYVRKTDGFLPRAHFAFLDEIWKSSPGILNTLLTIINEKIFRNGTETEKAPLKALIAASNETPPEKQGLEALYDRLVVRLYVPAVKEPGNFDKMIGDKPAESKTRSTHAITDDELKAWREQIHAVELSPETMSIIRDIRRQLDKQSERLNVYVSDRRWQQAATLLKAAAFFCDRKSTNLADALLLRHCLWTTNENREQVIGIVKKAVKDCGFESGTRSVQIQKDIKSLEREIYTYVLYAEDEYNTVTLKAGECFRVHLHLGDRYGNREDYKCYIPLSKMNARKSFHPVDESGQEIDKLTCSPFDKGKFTITSENLRLYNSARAEAGSNSYTHTPEILHHQGDRKENVPPMLIDALKDSLNKKRAEIGRTIAEIEQKRESFAKEISTPFVPEEVRNIALGGVDSQLHALGVLQKECDRLTSRITESK